MLMPAPWVQTSETPSRMLRKPSVTIKGFILSSVISTPWNRPISAPAASGDQDGRHDGDAVGDLPAGDVGAGDQDRGHHAAEGDHGFDRQVDAARQDDEGLPGGDDADRRRFQRRSASCWWANGKAGAVIHRRCARTTRTISGPVLADEAS